MNRRNTVLVTALTVCAALLLASCDNNKPTPAPTPAPQTTPESIIANPSPVASPDEKSSKNTTIYKVGSNAEGMGKLEPVELDMDPTDPASAVLALNKMGEEEKSPLPKNTRALSIRFEGDGLATVNFSPELEKNFEGGDMREALMFNAILATIGQFGDVKRVQILVDGKKVAIGGTQDTTQPLNIPSDPNAAPKSER